MNWYVLSQVELRTPAWLFLALMPIVFNVLARWRKQQWTRYAEPHLHAWALRRDTATPRRLIHVVSLWLFWILLAISLAGPRISVETLDNQRRTRHDIDLMIVLDVSASMGATDVTPTRLARAKLKLHDLLSRLHGERIGVVVYAGEAGLLLPLTDDMAAVAQSLEIADASLLDAPGSHLAAALNLARHQLKRAQRTGAILLISDGETSSLSGAAGEAAIQATRALDGAKIPVYAWIMASAEGGAVPQADQSAWDQPAQVISRPDFESYRKLFTVGNGRVIQVSDSDQDLAALYTQGILSLPGSRQDHSNTHQWRELYRYPLVLALMLLLANDLRIRARRTLVMAALAGSAPVGANDAAWREAYEAYHQRQYLLAQQYYRGLNGYTARMGEGAAAYRRRDFEYAARQFTQALLQAQHDAQRADALFNLGNSFYYAGNLRAAGDAFAGVLHHRAGDTRALENLARVRNSLRTRNAMAPQQEGIPGRRGRGLGEAIDDNERSRGIEDSKEKPAPLGSSGVADAAYAQAMGQRAIPSAGDQEANRRAALKKLELLQDRRILTIKQMLRQDAHQPTPGDLSPW